MGDSTSSFESRGAQEGEKALPDAVEDVADSLSDRWIDLFGVDEAPELQPEMFSEAVRELDRLLEIRPDAKEETVAILEDQFGRPPQHDSWASFTRRLTNYWGEGPAYLLNWLVYSNTGIRLAALSERASPRVVAYLRSIVALFWDQMNATQYLITSTADDWLRVDKHVLYDRLEDRTQFTLTITKVGGDVVKVDTRADGILILVGHLMVMIAAVGSTDEFSPDRVSTFLEQVSAAVDVFTSSEDVTNDRAAAPGDERDAEG